MAMRHIDYGYVERIQETNPIRRRAINAGRHPLYTLKSVQKLQPDISECPTIETKTIKPSTQAKVTRPRLPLDQQNRPYFKMLNSDPDTLKLVAFVVDGFHKLEGCYPTAIVLPPLRYIQMSRLEYYYVPGANVQIPYTYELGATYDVLARGSNYYQR